MAVSVLEVVSTPGLTLPTTGATAGVTTTTSPVTDDCVLVILNTQYDRVITGVSGLGGTWYPLYSYSEPSTNYGSQSIWVCTNPVSAGAITVSAANAAAAATAAAQLTALHVRGLPNPAPLSADPTTGSAITASSSIPATVDELVIGALYLRPGPISSFTPSPAGWVVQPAVLGGPSGAAYLQTAYLIPTAATTASFTFAGTGTFRSTSLVRIVSAVPPAPGSGRVVEHQAASLTTVANVTSSVNLPFTTVPTARDVAFVVVAIAAASGGQTVTVSGLGAVWKLVQSLGISGTSSYWLFAGRGPTTGGSVQASVLAPVVKQFRAVALLATGLAGSEIYHQQHTSFTLNDLKAPGSGFDFSNPVAPGTLVIGITPTYDANYAFPNAASYSGFEYDLGSIAGTLRQLGVAWLVTDEATPSPFQLGVTVTAGSSIYVPLSEFFIAGPQPPRAVSSLAPALTAVTSAVALNSAQADVLRIGGFDSVRATQGYVEALTVTQVALVENHYYAEMVTELPSTLRMAALNLDAMTKAPSTVRAATAYVEVLHRAPPVVKDSIGYWGILQAGP